MHPVFNDQPRDVPAGVTGIQFGPKSRGERVKAGGFCSKSGLFNLKSRQGQAQTASQSQENKDQEKERRMWHKLFSLEDNAKAAGTLAHMETPTIWQVLKYTGKHVHEYLSLQDVQFSFKICKVAMGNIVFFLFDTIINILVDIAILISIQTFFWFLIFLDK